MRWNRKAILQNKTLRALLLLFAVLLLLILIWSVFFQDMASSGNSITHTEEELRLIALLEELDGVEYANVLIAREDESVIIIFEGNDGILTRMQVLDIAAAATEISKNNILIYTK